MRKIVASPQGSSRKKSQVVRVRDHGFRNRFVDRVTERCGVCPFGNLDDDQFAAACSIEILMQFQTQLADMNAN
jgi:hypothetical protein